MILKKILKDRRIKQVELAKALGVDPSATSLFLNGWKPIPERHIKPISKFLKIPESKLRKLK